MATQEITLSLPENLYLRLQRMAQATQQPFADVLLHAVEVGSPPSWEDAPTEEMMSLFHPRQHKWMEHFAWDAAGIRQSCRFHLAQNIQFQNRFFPMPTLLFS